MRASRLVTLLLLLQTRGRLTAAELARELEVSERTVHRDVEALSEAGVPIYAERGPHGGVQLVDGYRTRLTGMTGDEAEALFLSGLPGPAAELGLGTVMTAAQLKVLAALPGELRARASRLVERFYLDVAGWFHDNEPVPQLATLAEAVWDARPVTIDYERGDRRVVREIGPLGLVLKAGTWYVVALFEGEPRTYRVSRVATATLGEGHFTRPEGFDLAAFWTESSAAYEREVLRLPVVVRVAPGKLERLAEFVGWRAIEQAEELGEPDADGWKRFRLRLDWPEEVPGKLLGIGGDLEVLDPPEVRAELVALASGAVARHAPVTPTGRADR
ncbi:MAG TPA: WYL domain-containing protein [Candidatus Limnocylindria bacterium]|nr:WYL domain-containing protein [Candidatus Limnocylindria bacterium]